ncbi:leucine-rich repeat, immunoglobulin-like domain and transmembrane domain-containing protein 2 [Tubulanus polymorphus]|uniref:leucine-rich repeat, immunoglobulin-like domain and transmembrane domain-containing protein 2 n=1 Tax=Tubulanus polymorphus TaxID=672921 RepID=UPI003DA5651E
MIEDRFTALCTNRGLTSIPATIPVGINAMHFENNSLVTLHDNTLEDFGSLRHLYLGFNKISEIEHEAFFGVRNLIVLDLEGNQLQSVPYTTLHDLRSLVYLNLKHNPLKKINVYSFPGLPMLETLELANCQIKYVHPKAFLGLNSLKELNLAYNKLDRLNSEMHETLSHSLRTVRLYGNPWICDCHLRWLKVWLMMANLNWVFGNEVPQCTHPHGLEGGKWNKLQIDFYACLPTISPAKTSIAATNNVNITLSCDVYSHPKGKVRWFKDKTLIQEESLYSIITPNDGDFNFTTRLTIVNTNRNNSGAYMCEASNFAGRVVGEIVVGVQSPDDPLELTFDTGAVIGIIVAGVVVLVMICLTVILCRRKRRRRTFAAKKPTTIAKSTSNASELAFRRGGDHHHIDSDHKDNSLTSFKIQANPFYTDPYRFPQPDNDDKERQRIFAHGGKKNFDRPDPGLRSPMKRGPSPGAGSPHHVVQSDYVTIRPNQHDWPNQNKSAYENDNYHWSPSGYAGNKPITFRPYTSPSFPSEGGGSAHSGDEGSRTHSLESFNHRATPTGGIQQMSSIEDEGGYVYGTVV